MSILTDLRAALEAKEQADAQLRQPITSDPDYRAKRQRWIQAEQQLHHLLTDDTIASLIAVARAAEESFVSTDPDAIPALFRALAPLVKEATDE